MILRQEQVEPLCAVRYRTYPTTLDGVQLVRLVTQRATLKGGQQVFGDSARESRIATPVDKAVADEMTSIHV